QQTVSIEYRWADGRFDRSPDIVREFVRANVDVIVTNATPNVLAAKRATSAIPIVFASAGDPVGNGLVTSLSRPGGNITGLSVQGGDLSAKVVDLLRQTLPGLRRIAFLSHVNNPVTMLQRRAFADAASSAGIDTIVAEVWNAEHLVPAIRDVKG